VEGETTPRRWPKIPQIVSSIFGPARDWNQGRAGRETDGRSPAPPRPNTMERRARQRHRRPNGEADRPSGAPHPGQAEARSLAVHFSSRSDEWPTPQGLFDQLHHEFGFNLDPCSTHANAKCARHFTRQDNGLTRDWGNAVVFMNPPYGREIRHWMAKAFASAGAGATVVCLVPARTDTEWWHRYAIQGEVRFLKGRLKFGDARHGAPFPSAIVVFRPGLRAGINGDPPA